MSITDVFRVNKIKAELEQTQKERDILKSSLADTERMNFYELKQAIADLSEKKSKVTFSRFSRHKGNRVY